MKVMFLGFAFVLAGLTMQLGVYIMASQQLQHPLGSWTTPPGYFGTVVNMLGLSSTLRTAHILTIGGLAIMMIEPAKDLIIKLIERQRPKQ